MEISRLSENAVKIKGKTVVIGIDPTAGKGPIDAAVLLNRSLSPKEIITDGDPLIINGPGEYEIKGIKMSGLGKKNDIVYSARIDNIRVCCMNASALPKTKDILEECEIVLINADNIPDQKLLIGLNPNVVVLYGQFSEESAKALGKESVPVGKYTVTRDKLSAELDAVML